MVSHRIRNKIDILQYGCYVPANGNFLKMTEKSIDMFPRIDAIKNAMQTSIPSTQAILHVGIYQR